MNNLNGWQEIPILGTGSISSALLSVGTQAFRKGNLKLLYSAMEHHPDGLWKHASISHNERYPTWDEILDIRYTFFDSNNDVFQVLPPKNEYVNIHKNCFHLWSPIGRRITPG